MFAVAPALALNEGQTSQLEALVRDGGTSQRVAVRCRVILWAHQGEANLAIAQQSHGPPYWPPVCAYSQFPWASVVTLANGRVVTPTVAPSTVNAAGLKVMVGNAC
jgi:hypothetical protein